LHWNISIARPRAESGTNVNPHEAPRVRLGSDR